MVTTKADIESRIISVVAKCIGLSPDKLDIYILFEIEKEFNINIPPESLEQYGFSSINGICSVVQDVLEHT